MKLVRTSAKSTLAKEEVPVQVLHNRVKRGIGFLPGLPRGGSMAEWQKSIFASQWQKTFCLDRTLNSAWTVAYAEELRPLLHQQGTCPRPHKTLPSLESKFRYKFLLSQSGTVSQAIDVSHFCDINGTARLCA